MAKEIGNAVSRSICVSVANAAANSRRQVSFCLFVGLLLTRICLAQAGDNLLDPSKIGAGRKSVQSEGLLDPARPGGAARQSFAASTRRPGVNHRSPSYARDMASSVVSSLNNLTRAAADLVDQVLELEARERRLASELQTLQEEMADKMAEYRNGLFCSGCNRTKSEILAKGDTFPHPNQHIVRPTPEQIAAKERELQAPIDRTDRELREVRAKRIKATDEREEAILQLGYGLNFWRTGISFENSLIWLEENESAAAYKSARAKADDQIHKLQIEMRIAKDKARLAELSRESEMWITTQDKLDRQRTDARRASQNALQRAATTATNELSELVGYLRRGKLWQVFSGGPDASFASPASGFDELGGKYRMGSYQPSGHDEVLSRVNSFISEFRKSPRSVGESTKGRKDAAPAANEQSTPKVKGILKDLLKCDPEAGGECPPARKNVGTGIRG